VIRIGLFIREGVAYKILLFVQVTKHTQFYPYS